MRKRPPGGGTESLEEEEETDQILGSGMPVEVFKLHPVGKKKSLKDLGEAYANIWL